MHTLTTSWGRLQFSRKRILYFILGIIAIFIIERSGLILHFLEVDYNKFSYPLDINMEEMLATIRKGGKVPYQPINEYNFPYRISNEKKCLQGFLMKNHEKVVILYVIKSATNHKNRRDVIRKTWGWENRFSDVLIKRIFVLGTTNDVALQDDIDEEYARNKDIVQAEFIDSYYNNTIKTMMSFKWVVLNCPKVQFVMFADDDMYISTKNLLKFIRNPFNRRVGFRKRRDVEKILLSNRSSSKASEAPELSQQTSGSSNLIYNSRKLFEYDPVLSAFDGRLLAGYVFNSSPMRHKSSKWYMPLSEYPYSKYPPYVTAGAYVLSYPALEDMYYTSMFTKHFRFDDVYLGIVAKKCGISPLHNDHFYFWREPYTKDSYVNVIASHGFSDPEELQKVWDEQRSSGHA
ncbi:beta-1,3-galactosyltransferase brn [Parasteatoda tepidariorum]|uniref:beta-1,3-galactosyltransferase brn n=1 Tax=Parasteatoda tepidariorum TaxID=114398 RepID=UPI00077FA5C1|nr:beta-1,3-galactosyltransferase brn [Parasteatoda tepidariorum]